MTSSSLDLSSRAALMMNPNVSQIGPQLGDGHSAIRGPVDRDREVSWAPLLAALDPAHATLGRKPYSHRKILQCEPLVSSPGSKFHGLDCSNNWNKESNEYVPKNGADVAPVNTHYPGMESDWYITEWLTYAQKRQADLVNDLGWSRRRASDVCSGAQPYKRDIVNEIASWLGVEPYELLMPPEDAVRLRHIRQAMLAIAKQKSPLKELKE